MLCRAWYRSDLRAETASKIGYPGPIILHWCTVLRIILICCWPTCNIITSNASDTVFSMRTWAAGDKKNCRRFGHWQACTVELESILLALAKTANVPVAHNFCSNKSTVSQALPVAMSQVGHQWVKTDVRWIWRLPSVLNVTPNLSDLESRYVLKTQPAHTLIFPLRSKNTFSLIFQSTRLRSSVKKAY